MEIRLGIVCLKLERESENGVSVESDEERQRRKGHVNGKSSNFGV